MYSGNQQFKAMIKQFIFLFGMLLLLGGCKILQSGKSNTATSKINTSNQAYTNKLINETSPYLRQHANNPVNWYPWGEEALQKAQSENKMLLISVGYAACHWCNVMEKESFEDPEVAEWMNKYFIAIKIDREERPDIDDVYMTACRLASDGNCGWPLNAFALPDGRPYWAGTYYPKEQWIKILQYFVGERAKSPDKLEKWAAEITEGIQTTEQISFNEDETLFNTSTLEQVAGTFLKNIDYKKGGRNVPLKFPMPNNYQFLLRYHSLVGDRQALKAVEVTLNNMARGGIYDQLGGGFARYATDTEWKVPHFEKMLYDNGQLVSLYSEAYRLTKKPLYQNVVFETLNFIEREMTASDGGFYSSLDADSGGEEGQYYVWNKAEIVEVLANDEVAEIFCDYYNVSEKGNWNGKNILHRTKSDEKLTRKYGITTARLDFILADSKKQLFNYRSARVRPDLDNKVLTSWNAIMLKGYVDAYRTFGEEKYLDIALKNAKFLLKKVIQKNNRVTRNYKDGRTSINGFLDDYAFLVDAFIALYQATFDEKWLYKAKGLMDYAILHFYDETSGMFYYTSNMDDPLVARKMEINDNVIPASNSVVARGLQYLGLYFYEEGYIEKSKAMLNNLVDNILTTQQPNFYSNWCNLMIDVVHEPFEVAIVGKEYRKLRREMDTYFIPNIILLGGAKEGSLELLDGKLIDNETTIYVCRNKVCKVPVNKVEHALELMEEERIGK